MSSTTPRVDLRPDHWEIVRNVLRQHFPMRRVVAFGSRATWTAKEYSDLDLAILGEEPLPLDAVAAMAEGFRESDLPFKVDVVVWANINDHLRDIILLNAVDVQTPKAGPASTFAPSSAADRLHLSASHRRVLEGLLHEHLPDVEVWAYGSRVNGRCHDGSDLDLVMRGPGLENVPAQQLADFADAVRDSTIPFLVEARDWARLPERFRREIEGHHAVLSGPLVRSVEWPTLTLRDAGVQLIDCVHKTPAAQESGYPYIGIPQMKSGRLDFESARKISHEDFVDWTKKAKAQPHDVILSRRTNPGVTAIDRRGTEFALGQNLVLLRADGSRVDPAFLKWLVRSPAWWREIGKFINVGAVFDSLRCADVPNFELPIPPRAAQLRIAEILDSLDDKIELNRRMNETLEAMARALFKSWFVDFEPVRAKIAGRDVGLPRDIADLFPDHLVESPIGQVPRGWDISQIGKEVTAVGGSTPSTKVDAFWLPGEHAWATPKDLSTLTVPVLLGTAKKVTPAGLATISSGLLPKGTVMMSSRAPIGYLAIAETPVAVNQGFIAMVCTQRLPNLYVLFWCRENLNHIRNIAGGSTFAEISKRVFRPIPVMVPPPEVLDSFSCTVRPLYARMVANVKQTACLAGIRDLLLPKLVSGEVHVQHSEKALAAIR